MTTVCPIVSSLNRAWTFAVDLSYSRAEREQSLRVRVLDLFSDMRMLWPALGATTAVLLCLSAAGSIWRLSMERHPNSFATLLDTWGMPGTEQNPLRIDNADLRLTPIGRELGLVDDERWQLFEMKQRLSEQEFTRLNTTRVHPERVPAEWAERLDQPEGARKECALRAR